MAYIIQSSYDQSRTNTYTPRKGFSIPPELIDRK